MSPIHIILIHEHIPQLIIVDAVQCGLSQVCDLVWSHPSQVKLFQSLLQVIVTIKIRLRVDQVVLTHDTPQS